MTGQGCLNKSQAFSRTSRVHPPVPGVSQGPLLLLCLHCNPPSSPTPTPALLCSPPVVLDQQHPITWMQRREPRSQAPPSYTARICILTRSPEWGGASLVAKMVQNLPAMRETQVRSLGLEDPLDKGMATPEFHGQRRLAASMGLQSLTRLRDSHFHFQEGEGASHHVFTAPWAVVLCLVESVTAGSLCLPWSGMASPVAPACLPSGFSSVLGWQAFL